jgi:hypothetical protein
MNFTLKRPLSLVAAGAALWVATALPAHAALKHRYTFNFNADDSVGGMNATVVDPGAQTAVFAVDGQLDLSGNVGQASNAVTNDAYVDLPNLIVEGAAQSGTSGALSFEWWFTVSETRTWQRLGDFGGPLAAGGSENVTNNGQVSYMLVSPNSGRNNNGLEMTNNYATPTTPITNTENMLGKTAAASPALAPGVQHHAVAVYDKNDTKGGVNLGGTMRLYLNGAEIVQGTTEVNGSGAIHPDFNLNDLNDEDNWLGRSQWPDPVFDGKFNEFSIYDHPLTPAEVSANFAGGPVPPPSVAPVPTLIVNTVTGAAAIKNNSPAAVNIDYYEIASPSGRLNAANGAWNSLDDQNIDAGLPSDFNNSTSVDGADLTVWKGAYVTNANGDADGDGDSDGNDLMIWQRQVGQSAGPGDSWDESGGNTDNLLVELFLNGSTNLAVNEQIGLGSPFRTGAAQDLTFKFGLAGGGLAEGAVVYVTTGPASAVPEPAACGLIAMAAAMFAVRRRK